MMPLNCRQAEILYTYMPVNAPVRDCLSPLNVLAIFDRWAEPRWWRFRNQYGTLRESRRAEEFLLPIALGFWKGWIDSNCQNLK